MDRFKNRNKPGTYYLLDHKGYDGTIQKRVHPHDKLRGEILDIRPVITYEGDSYEDIKKAFQKSVDEYIKNNTKPKSKIFWISLSIGLIIVFGIVILGVIKLL